MESLTVLTALGSTQHTNLHALRSRGIYLSLFRIHDLTFQSGRTRGCPRERIAPPVRTARVSSLCSVVPVVSHLSVSPSLCPRLLTLLGRAPRDTGEVLGARVRDVLFRSYLRYCTSGADPQTAFSGCASYASINLYHQRSSPGRRRARYRKQGCLGRLAWTSALGLRREEAASKAKTAHFGGFSTVFSEV